MRTDIALLIHIALCCVRAMCVETLGNDTSSVVFVVVVVDGLGLGLGGRYN